MLEKERMHINGYKFTLHFPTAQQKFRADTVLPGFRGRLFVTVRRHAYWIDCTGPERIVHDTWFTHLSKRPAIQMVVAVEEHPMDRPPKTRHAFCHVWKRLKTQARRKGLFFEQSPITPDRVVLFKRGSRSGYAQAVSGGPCEKTGISKYRTYRINHAGEWTRFDIDRVEYSTAGLKELEKRISEL